MSNKEDKKQNNKLKGRRSRPNPHGKAIIKGQNRRVRGPGRRHKH